MGTVYAKNSPIIKTKGKLTSDDYVKMAEAYLHTAKILIDHHIKEIENQIPLYYLLSHSLELYLKGYLYKKTKSEKKGHDLLDLYKQCEGLHLTVLEIAQIEFFNHYNNEGSIQTYLLRYPGIDASVLPNLQISTSLLNNIHNQLRADKK